MQATGVSMTPMNKTEILAKLGVVRSSRGCEWFLVKNLVSAIWLFEGYQYLIYFRLADQTDFDTGSYL